MDHWSSSDLSLSGEFSRAKFALMLDKKPLVMKTESSPMVLCILGHLDLKTKLAHYGLKLNPASAALLDAVGNEDGDYVPLLGVSLKSLEMPEDSPVPIEMLRDQLAQSMGGSFVDLRVALLTLPSEKERNLVARMQSLLKWSHIWRRCPKCASPLKMRLSKTAAACLACREFFYPPFYPVASCLVKSYDDSKVLMIRHRSSANNIYTVISGFAQVGETFEETVRREVAEEVGIECTEVKSLGFSTSWPIPQGSLMCAFEATANCSDELTVNVDELETAQWYNRDEISQAFENTREDPHLRGRSKSENASDFRYIPPLGSLAYQLIERWLKSR